MTREEKIEGLLKRIQFAVENDRTENEIAHLVNIIDKKLETYMQEDGHDDFWRALTSVK